MAQFFCALIRVSEIVLRIIRSILEICFTIRQGSGFPASWKCLCLSLKVRTILSLEV